MGVRKFKISNGSKNISGVKLV